MITDIDDAIGRGREAMPKESPSTGWVRKGDIIGMFAEEVTVITTISRTGKGSRVTKGLRKEVNLNKIPTGSVGADRSVGNSHKRGGHGMTQ